MIRAEPAQGVRRQMQDRRSRPAGKWCGGAETAIRKEARCASVESDGYCVPLVIRHRDTRPQHTAVTCPKPELAVLEHETPARVTDWLAKRSERHRAGLP